MTEHRWDIPEAWCWQRMGALGLVVGGGTPAASDPSNFAENGIAWITPADLTGYAETYIERGSRDLSPKGYAASGAQLMPAGSVLFSSRAPVGHCAIAATNVSTNQGFKSLVPNEAVVSEFVRLYLVGSKDYAESQASGTTFLELSGARFAELAVPLAPLPEQRRIVAKVEGLRSRTSRARAELNRIPTLVANYKAALLAVAFSGDLTADWRVAQGLPDPTQTTLGEVAADLSYGSSAKSARSGSVPVLRMGNIQDGQLDWGNLVYTSDTDEIRRYTLQAGDVLFNRTNSPELVGKSALYMGERPAIYAGYLIRVRCSARLLPAFLTYQLNGPAGRAYCWQVKTDGVSQSNINASKLREFSFLLPHIDEQAEIVRRIDAAFAWLDRVVSEHRATSRLLPRLDAAILAKAFRGELVPQDPADEPAVTTLARVAAARAAAPTARRGRRARAD